jgi:hypothetical protein
MYDITWPEIFSSAIQGELFESSELLVDFNDPVTAMIAAANGDAFGV